MSGRAAGEWPYISLQVTNCRGRHRAALSPSDDGDVPYLCGIAGSNAAMDEVACDIVDTVGSFIAKVHMNIIHTICGDIVKCFPLSFLRIYR